MKRIGISFIVCLCVLAAIEWSLRTHLFRHASYSNSQSIDEQLSQRNASSTWRILFIGDSEVRWAIHPADIDERFLQQGIRTSSFNHAFDGFGASWWPLLLPRLLAHPSLQQVKVVALGIQLIDLHQTITPEAASCGALQKPVLTSAFAVDLGVNQLCAQEPWDTRLGQRLFSTLWTVRYAPAVRSLLLPKAMLPSARLGFNSRKSGPSINGFEPHASIGTDHNEYDREFQRWEAQYHPVTDFTPLPAGRWRTLVQPGGFFDGLLAVVRESGRELVLFASPTNPVVIDTFKRRMDYGENSAALGRWARAHNVLFIDLGIQDVSDSDRYFSDMRHLSEAGAHTFSRALGEALVDQLPGSTLRSLGKQPLASRS